MQNKEQIEPLQNIFSEQKVKPISCIESRESHFICANNECSHSPFICNSVECKCNQNHDACLRLKKNSLISAIQNKHVSFKTIENKIKEEIQKAIDRLSEIETLLIAQSQQEFKNLAGLSELQKDFIKAIKQGKIDDIKGSTIFNIHNNLKEPKEVDSLMRKLESDINTILDQFQQNVTQLHTNIKTKLEAFCKEAEIFKDSKVLNKDEEYIIENFFVSQGQKIKSVRMLYRGSQHMFSAGCFHKSCDGQTQTITICQNTYGKKIGGYTPLAWNLSNTYLADNSNKSFTFSLTNNHKLVAYAGSSNHIYCNSTSGPTFGGGYDLYLADKCHQNTYSYAKLNHTYINPNYTYGSKESYELFTGSNQNYYFQVKECEVWKVQFA